MARTASALSSQLQSIPNTGSEVAAIEAFAEAYRVYCADATANGVPITPAALSAGKAAMAAALVGMSAPGVGAAKLQSGCAAFWTAVAALLAGAFSGATAITPPPCATIAAALTVTFAANVAARRNKVDACDLVAADMHTGAAGGTATFPGPVVAPIL